MRDVDRPFRGSLAPLSARALRTEYTRIFRDVYVPRDVEVDASVRALAAAEFAGPEAVVVGYSAAALLGAKWIPATPAEVVRSSGYTCPTKDLIVRRDRLCRNEIVRVHGVQVTTPGRTAFDLGRRLPRAEAVVALDSLIRATKVRMPEIEGFAEFYSRERGTVQLRQCLTVVDGGASRRRSR